MEVKDDFKEWCSIYSGFDGGNLKGNIWVCGLEWGYELKDFQKRIETDMKEFKEAPPKRYDDTDEGFKKYYKHPYNSTCLKVLATIHDKDIPIESPKKKGRLKKFFIENAVFNEHSNYLKFNMLPVPCKNNDTWSEVNKEMSGFDKKEEYKSWCLGIRKELISKMLNDNNPKLIILVGTTYIDDYKKCFGYADGDFKKIEYKEARDKYLQYYFDEDKKRLVVNVLFFGSRGLNSHLSIKETGNIIRKLVAKHDIDLVTK